MNLLLLKPEDFYDENLARIQPGRRYKHLIKILQVTIDSRICAGILNGNTGYAIVTAITPDYIELRTALTEPPPEPNPITLVLALPRPLMLKRILQTVTSMGVKTIYLINSKRVEKSYWTSSDLATDVIEQQLLLGLEQARDTVLPQVHFEKRFKPFAEDRLPHLCPGKTALLAHPGDYPPCPDASVQTDSPNGHQEIILAIGPEGGFIDYEVGLLTHAGLNPVQFGHRILRVEAAVSALLGRLTPL